jgi:hypothetical protein
MADDARLSREVSSDPAPEAAHDRHAEEWLARIVSWGIPAGTVAASLGLGVFAGLGPALLVLASGALLGAVALVWSSLRTLSGEVFVDDDVPGLDSDTTELGQRKLRVLLAIKDLEGERALGKIDEADYRELVVQYRDEAKRILRAIDLRAEPARAEAERVAEEYIARRGSPPGAKSSGPEETPPASRGECARCLGSNDVDASFCKHCGAPMKKDGARVGPRRRHHAKA